MFFLTERKEGFCRSMRRWSERERAAPHTSLLSQIWLLLNGISSPPVGTIVFPLQRDGKNQALMTQNLELGEEANLQSPHTHTHCYPASFRGNAGTTMLLRAAQTCPSLAGVHAVTSPPPSSRGRRTTEQKEFNSNKNDRKYTGVRCNCSRIQTHTHAHD